MSVESYGDIVVTMEDANAYFDHVNSLRRPDGKKMSQTEKGKILGVNQSTFSRNATRRKAGKDITDDMYEAIGKILREQLGEALRKKHLKEQAEAARAAEAKRVADKVAEQKRIKAQRRADEEKARRQRADDKADRERRAGVSAKLDPYWAEMRAQGLFKGLDPSTQGDAPELLAKAKPAELSYTSFDMALLALAPDDYQFKCGRTAAYLRAGRTAWHRLTGKYPTSRYRSLEFVPPILRPDAKLHYGHDYEDILSWQGMNERFSSLALEPLPLVLSPGKANGFSQFIVLHRRLGNGGYVFEGSCLIEPDDFEKRLREIKRRTILPRFGAGALKLLPAMASGAASAASLIVGFIVAFTAIYFAVWGLWAGGNWAVDTAFSVWNASVAWLHSVKWVFVGLVAAHGVLLVLGVWWAWPRESDRKDHPGVNISLYRFVAILGFLIVFAMAQFVVFSTFSAAK